MILAILLAAAAAEPAAAPAAAPPQVFYKDGAIAQAHGVRTISGRTLLGVPDGADRVLGAPPPRCVARSQPAEATPPPATRQTIPVASAPAEQNGHSTVTAIVTPDGRVVSVNVIPRAPSATSMQQPLWRPGANAEEGYYYPVERTDADGCPMPTPISLPFAKPADAPLAAPASVPASTAPGQ